MSKNLKVNITENIMSRIEKGQIKMKPKWYFWLGSLAMVMGIIGVTILSVFSVSLISFSLRTHGPMGEIRFQQLLSSFPWWAPLLAIFGLTLGIFFLKKYDFSYKKNFLIIISGFILAVILAGWLIDYSGLDLFWAKRGIMKRFYQQYDGKKQNGFKSDSNYLPRRNQGQNRIGN